MVMMDIGFTGTRKGMTARQKGALLALLLRLNCQSVQRLHHGGELHSDREAEEIAQSFGYHPVLHAASPPVAEQFLARDRDIVEAVGLLIAAPNSLVERTRSGTWYTIRYARKVGVPVIILDP